MTRAVLSTAAWLIGAAGVQQALSHRLAIGWAQPDFLLVVAVVASLHRSPDAAAVTGFFAGLLNSAIEGHDMLAFTVSRALVCMLSLKVYSAFLGTGALTSAIVTAIATAIAGLVYLFLGTPPNILGHLADTIGAIIYNGVIAVPIYALYRNIAQITARV